MSHISWVTSYVTGHFSVFFCRFPLLPPISKHKCSLEGLMLGFHLHGFWFNWFSGRVWAATHVRSPLGDLLSSHSQEPPIYMLKRSPFNLYPRPLFCLQRVYLARSLGCPLGISVLLCPALKPWFLNSTPLLTHFSHDHHHLSKQHHCSYRCSSQRPGSCLWSPPFSLSSFLQSNSRCCWLYPPKFLHISLFSCHWLSWSHHHYLFPWLFTAMISHPLLLLSSLLLSKAFSTEWPEWSFNLKWNQIISFPFNCFPKIKCLIMPFQGAVGFGSCFSLQTPFHPFSHLAHFAPAALEFF